MTLGTFLEQNTRIQYTLRLTYCYHDIKMTPSGGGVLTYPQRLFLRQGGKQTGEFLQVEIYVASVQIFRNSRAVMGEGREWYQSSAGQGLTVRLKHGTVWAALAIAKAVSTPEEAFLKSPLIIEPGILYQDDFISPSRSRNMAAMAPLSQCVSRSEHSSRDGTSICVSNDVMAQADTSPVHVKQHREDQCLSPSVCPLPACAPPIKNCLLSLGSERLSCHLGRATRHLRTLSQ
ncbi:hypothetical protein RRG08_021055 [Elysia crispata]|uniref:Uncharacterized protein n=1 Tax=Elysia crispata TaxID=231223 RepID=A0AAE0YZV6_9GAST|nr:hypothetical protein RRG08_021055 [Elysia crispata]